MANAKTNENDLVVVQELAKALLDQCRGCGIEARAFLNEKMLELEERKRIMLIPSTEWYRQNKHRYEDFASKMLSRPLNDAERFHKTDRLSLFVERVVFPQGTGVSLDPLTKKALLSDYNARCAHCGKCLGLQDTQVDHKLPKRQGGTDEITNLQPLCGRCNRGKGPMREDTAEASARPWFEQTHVLVTGKVRLTDTKRFCVIARDNRRCQRCGRSPHDVELVVALRVSPNEGGQPVYDNLVTVCSQCKDKP